MSFSMENMCSFQTCQCQDGRPSTEFIPSTPVGCTDLGGPPPGSAVPLQGLWIRRLDCSGFWVCPLQRTCLFLVTRAQTKLERQEPDHTPVPAVWGRQAAWTQDTAPAMLCCSSGWGPSHGHTGSFAVLIKERSRPFPDLSLDDISNQFASMQEIIFCLMKTWLPSTGVCWDQNTHLLLSR